MVVPRTLARAEITLNELFPCPPLEHADVCTVYVSLIGEVFLRHTVCFAALADHRAESLR